MLFAILVSQSHLLAKSFVPNHFNASYIQKEKSTLSGKMIESRGSINYLYPGHIKFEVSGENPEIFLSNPEKTVIYRPPFIPGEKGNARVFKTKNFATAKFFDVLRLGLKNNKYYTVKITKKDCVLNFEKDFVSKVKIVKADLTFKPNVTISTSSFSDIQDVTLTYDNKKEITYSFESIQENQKLTAKDFEFQIPEGTEIQDHSK